MKLAMIGLLGHNGYIYHALPDLPGMSVAAVCAGGDGDVTPMVNRLEEMGHCPRVYADYREMLDEVRPAFVSVGGPMELHGPMCVAAIACGAHVFCEKPIALTLEELDAIEAAHSVRPDLRIWAMTGMRFDGDYLAAYEAVSAGRIGHVRLIESRKSYKLGTRPAYYKRHETYGGSIPWIGSHVIDLIFAFSRSDVQSVYATHTREDNRGHGDLEVAAQCQFVMANGVLANCSLDFLRPESAPSHADNRLRIVGSTGVIEINNGEVELIDVEGVVRLEHLPARSIFAEFVRGGVTAGVAPVDSELTFAVARACLLARESAETGRCFTTSADIARLAH